MCLIFSILDIYALEHTHAYMLSVVSFLHSILDILGVLGLGYLKLWISSLFDCWNELMLDKFQIHLFVNLCRRNTNCDGFELHSRWMSFQIHSSNLFPNQILPSKCNLWKLSHTVFITSLFHVCATFNRVPSDLRMDLSLEEIWNSSLTLCFFQQLNWSMIRLWLSLLLVFYFFNQYTPSIM